MISVESCMVVFLICTSIGLCILHYKRNYNRSINKFIKGLNAISTIGIIISGIFLLFAVVSMDENYMHYDVVAMENVEVISDVLISGEDIEFVVEYNGKVAFIKEKIENVTMIDMEFNELSTVTKYVARPYYNNPIANKIFKPYIKDYNKEKVTWVIGIHSDRIFIE